MKKRKQMTIVVTCLIAALMMAGCAGVADVVTSSIPANTTQPVTTAAATPVPTASEQSALSYVSLDINPSIKLTIMDGVVIEASAMSDDGEEIITGVDVAGLVPQDAVSALIEAIAALGYFDAEDAALVITSSGADEEELMESLKDAARQTLDGLGLECEVTASCVEPEIVEEAKAAGLTPPRYLAIKYLAKKEGISFEEAKEKYGSMKMGALLKLCGHPRDVFGDKMDVDWDELINGLDPEQQQILEQAKNAYGQALRAAQSQFVQSKKDIQSQTQSKRAQIQNAYKETKDLAAYKQAKTQLQAEFAAQKREARQMFFAAKEQAKAQFREAVADLGFDEAVIKALLDWDYDAEWDEQINWDAEEAEADRQEASEERNEPGRPSENDKKAKGAPEEARGGKGADEGNGSGNSGEEKGRGNMGANPKKGQQR